MGQMQVLYSTVLMPAERAAEALQIFRDSRDGKRIVALPERPVRLAVQDTALSRR